MWGSRHPLHGDVGDKIRLSAWRAKGEMRREWSEKIVASKAGSWTGGHGAAKVSQAGPLVSLIFRRGNQVK